MLFNDSALKLKLPGWRVQALFQHFQVLMCAYFCNLNGKVCFFQFFHRHAEIIQYIVLDKIFISILKHLIRQVHDPCKLSTDFHIALCFPDAPDYRAGVPGNAARIWLELPSLKGGTGRKHDIRPHGRVCHEEVCINKEIQAFKGFKHASGIREHTPIQPQGEDGP